MLSGIAFWGLEGKTWCKVSQFGPLRGGEEGWGLRPGGMKTISLTKYPTLRYMTNYIMGAWNRPPMGLETCEGCTIWARNPYADAPRGSLYIGSLWGWKRVRGAACGPSDDDDDDADDDDDHDDGDGDDDGCGGGDDDDGNGGCCGGVVTIRIIVTSHLDSSVH